MCAKVKRNPLVASSCAEYLGYFTSSESRVCVWRGGRQERNVGEVRDDRTAEARETSRYKCPPVQSGDKG